MNRFDEVERQVRDIGARYWKKLDGRMIRSASEELRKGRIVIFGNRKGNMYLGPDENNTVLLQWEQIRQTDIGLFMPIFSETVVELNLTEIKLFNERKNEKKNDRNKEMD